MLLSIVLIILAGVFTPVLQTDYTLEKELNINADYFTVDQLGFLYTIENTEIKKIDLKTNQEKSYSNALSGEITFIDASDPFRTLIFYRDFNKIEFLDKNFTQIASPILLDNLGYYQVSAVCQSVNGGFWIFDQSLNQLIYIDKNLKAQKKSSQLSDLIDQNIGQEQVFMLEKNDYIYLGVRGQGILLFDNYGTYIKTFPLIDCVIFQVNNGVISYFKNDKLYFYNTNNYEEKSISLPKGNCKQVIIEKKKLFIKSEKKIFVYQLNNF